MFWRILAAIGAVVLLVWFLSFVGWVSYGHHAAVPRATVTKPGPPVTTTVPAPPATNTAPTPPAPPVVVTLTPTPAPAVAQAISVDAPVGRVPRIFALSGSGDIPAGWHLVVFVRDSGTGRYYTDGDASATQAHQWTVPRVYLGSTDPCDNGHIYKVFMVVVDDASDTANSSFHEADPDAGYTPTEWNGRFGDFHRVAVDVTRAGAAPSNC
jgi:hypothetical protein